jgi:hypothetical protein
MFRLQEQELFNYPELYRVGITPEMECLRVKEGVLVTHPTDANLFMPLTEKLFSFGRLVENLRSQGLEHLHQAPRSKRWLVIEAVQTTPNGDVTFLLLKRATRNSLPRHQHCQPGVSLARFPREGGVA